MRDWRMAFCDDSGLEAAAKLNVLLAVRPLVTEDNSPDFSEV
jgi:hypothetical protein